MGRTPTWSGRAHADSVVAGDATGWSQYAPVVTKPRTARCPTCKDPVRFEEGTPRPSWAPFCSERCKLIDLGRWLGEEHRIPGPPALLDEMGNVVELDSDGNE